MSGLDVRDRAAILKGGTRGPAIVPGVAEQSLLYKAVTRTGELKMPPGKTGAPQTQIMRSDRGLTLAHPGTPGSSPQRSRPGGRSKG